MLNRLTKSVDLRADAKSVTVDKGGIGSITAYAATFTREPDLTGDVIARGAFAKFLARMEEEGAVMPLLYNHDQSLGSFIGKVTDIREDDHGLLFTATFDRTEKAQRARELVMDGRLSKLSFAYLVRDAKEITLPDGRLANELRELDVDEVSLVLMPANPDTSVVEVKACERCAKAAPRSRAPGSARGQVSYLRVYKWRSPNLVHVNSTRAAGVHVHRFSTAGNAFTCDSSDAVHQNSGHVNP